MSSQCLSYGKIVHYACKGTEKFRKNKLSARENAVPDGKLWVLVWIFVFGGGIYYACYKGFGYCSPIIQVMSHPSETPAIR